MVLFHMNPKAHWIIRDDIAVSGFCFYHNTIYRDEDFADLIRVQKTEEGITQLLHNAYGRYAFALKTETAWFIAADPLRTLPLYYRTIGNGDWVFTDQPDLILKQGDTLNRDAADEMKCLAYVLGNETLINGLYTSEAGSYMVIAGNTLRTERYIHLATGVSAERETCIKALHEGYSSAFDRLAKYLDGRQAVIPLSGGMDSRFILATLTARRYKNILAFTYGKKEEKEVLYSKAIAEKCGVNWICIPYKTSKMRKMHKHFGSRASSFCGHYTTCLFAQDYYAIWYLLENHLINSDAVIVPGHTIGNVAELSSPKLREKDSFSPRELARIFLQGNYVYSKSILHSKYNLLFSRLLSRFPNQNEMYSALESYTILKEIGYQERQCKHIANSALVYRFFGLDCYMPFYDLSIFYAWYGVPWEYAERRAIYYELIETEYPTVYSACNSYGHENEYAPKVETPLSFKERMKEKFPNFYNIYNTVNILRNDNMNLIGIASILAYFKSALDGAPNIDGIMIREYLKQVETNLNKKGGN